MGPNCSKVIKSSSYKTEDYGKFDNIEEILGGRDLDRIWDKIP